MRISNKIVWREVDGEIFAIDALNEKIHELNETASFIFAMINKGFSREEIAKKVRENYEVNDSVCKADIEEIISDMIRKGIIDEK